MLVFGCCEFGVSLRFWLVLFGVVGYGCFILVADVWLLGWYLGFGVV